MALEEKIQKIIKNHFKNLEFWLYTDKNGDVAVCMGVKSHSYISKKEWDKNELSSQRKDLIVTNVRSVLMDIKDLVESDLEKLDNESRRIYS